MLSVLLPTYNYNIQQLVKLLNSQLTDVDFEFEILVLDDCSTRQDLIIANQTVENLPYCFFHRNDKNLGRTATRHKLAQLAKFDYLLFLDADTLPINENFIDYFNIENQKADVVFGGISYQKNKPDRDKMLRWKYGKSREYKLVSERRKVPYLSIISACCLIKKDLFLKSNTFLESVYGADVLFAHNLEQMQVKVEHIDNPVVHLGLETNTLFLEKTINGLKTLFELEQSCKVPNNYRPIQKMRLFLSRFKLSWVFLKLTGLFEKKILKNLNGRNPLLFLFDIYRLYIYQKMFH